MTRAEDDARASDKCEGEMLVNHGWHGFSRMNSGEGTERLVVGSSAAGAGTDWSDVEGKLRARGESD